MERAIEVWSGEESPAEALQSAMKEVRQEINTRVREEGSDCGRTIWLAGLFESGAFERGRRRRSQ